MRHMLLMLVALSWAAVGAVAQTDQAVHDGTVAEFAALTGEAVSEADVGGGKLAAEVRLAGDLRTLRLTLANKQLTADLAIAAARLSAAGRAGRQQYAYDVNAATTRYQQSLTDAHTEWSQGTVDAFNSGQQAATRDLQGTQTDMVSTLQRAQQAFASSRGPGPAPGGGGGGVKVLSAGGMRLPALEWSDGTKHPFLDWDLLPAHVLEGGYALRLMEDRLADGTDWWRIEWTPLPTTATLTPPVAPGTDLSGDRRLQVKGASGVRQQLPGAMAVPGMVTQEVLGDGTIIRSQTWSDGRIIKTVTDAAGKQAQEIIWPDGAIKKGTGLGTELLGAPTLGTGGSWVMSSSSSSAGDAGPSGYSSRRLPDGRVVRTDYWPDARTVETTTWPDGRVTTKTYYPDGRVETGTDTPVVDVLGDSGERTKPPAESPTHSSSSITPDGTTTRVDNYADGRRVETVTRPDGQVTETTYYPDGTVKWRGYSKDQPTPGPGPAPPSPTPPEQKPYPSAMTSRALPDGTSIQTTYWSDGRTVESTYYPSGQVVHKTYWPDGRVTSGTGYDDQRLSVLGDSATRVSVDAPVGAGTGVSLTGLPAGAAATPVITTDLTGLSGDITGTLNNAIALEQGLSAARLKYLQDLQTALNTHDAEMQRAVGHKVPPATETRANGAMKTLERQALAAFDAYESGVRSALRTAAR